MCRVDDHAMPTLVFSVYLRHVPFQLDMSWIEMHLERAAGSRPFYRNLVGLHKSELKGLYRWLIGVCR